MYKINSSFIVTEIINIVKRFPLPTLVSVCAYILTLMRPAIEDLIYLKISLNIYLWFIALKLFSESFNLSKTRYYVIGFLIAIFIFGQTLLLIVSNKFVILELQSNAILILLFIAPFIKNDSSNLQIWNFNYKIIRHLFFTTSACFILILGIALIIACLNYLLEYELLKLYTRIFPNILIIISVLISPIYMLKGIPKNFNDLDVNYSQALKNISSYVIIPLLTVYAIIIYGYGAKILIDWNLPKGGIIYIVLGFSSIGLITYLLSYPMASDSVIISLFQKYFFIVLIAPLVLYAFSIGIRIYNHGITEDRYIIVMFLIWFSLCIFFVQSKYIHQSFKLIYLNLIVLLIIAACGPISAINISSWNQTSRLVNLIDKNSHPISENNLNNIYAADQAEISGIINYLISSGKTTDLKNALVKYNLPEELNYNESKAVVEALGISYVIKNSPLLDKARFSYPIVAKSNYINIKDYDYLIEINSLEFDKSSSSQNFSILDKNLSVNFNTNTNDLIVQLSSNELLKFNLGDILQIANKSQALSMLNNNDGIRQKFLIKDSASVKCELILEHAYGEILNNENKFKLSSFTATMLIKFK